MGRKVISTSYSSATLKVPFIISPSRDDFFKAIISKKGEEDLSGCNITIEIINELIAHLYL